MRRLHGIVLPLAIAGSLLLGAVPVSADAGDSLKALGSLLELAGDVLDDDDEAETEKKEEKKEEKKNDKKKEEEKKKELDLSSKEVITAVQEALNKEGFECGTADGVIGNKTKEAIVAYKQKKELEATDEITEELLKKMEIYEKLTEDSEKKSEAIDGIRPEFKEVIDNYEDFFNEYAEFMMLFNENPSDMQLLLEYTEYMAKYAEYMDDLDDMETEDMSDEEEKYYLDATIRIEQKLVDVAYALD